jgi:hypothetical protein
MKKRRVVLLGLLLISVVYSCKLDKPVAPGDNGTTSDTNNTNTIQGNIVNGMAVSNANLTGNWVIQSTTAQYYDKYNVSVSNSLISNNAFISVALDDQARAANFQGLSSAVPAEENYMLSSTTGKDLYIQLSSDPFARTSNTKIQITNLTATSMTWLAIDPQLISLGGQFLRNAYLVTFSKKP